MTATKDCAIKDISLADWGRKEIAIAEVEMPGLVATRAECRRPATRGSHRGCRISTWSRCR